MRIKFAFPLAALILASACSEHEDLLSAISGKDEIRLQGTIKQINTTRVDDSGFADDDVMGVYVVNYENGNPGTLQPSGNQATNVRFVYNRQENTWTGAIPIYFKDKNTPVDAYGYYPYDDAITNVTAYPFTVERNQSTEATTTALGGYEASDFLWAKCANVSSSTPLITLEYQHQMACVRVTLVEGEGFENTDWASLEKSVLVENTYRNSTIDLSTGEVSVVAEDGTPQGIITSNYGSDYRAVVVPQTVAAGSVLLSITVDGYSYQLKRSDAMTYTPGKMHNFTIQVNNSAPTGDYQFTLIDESITAWESDMVSHNGKAREYVVVNVPEAGGLENAIKAAGLDPEKVINLKITGELTQGDFDYMRPNMKYIEALNLKEVVLRKCGFTQTDTYYDEMKGDYILPYGACYEMKYLTYVVLPDKLKKIGENAFRCTPLSGSLVIPEGVTHIGGSAFSNWGNYTEVRNNLSGTLTLPSTLTYIGGSAFEDCDFTGELILPETVDTIGSSAFVNCNYMTGELHLPSGIKYIGTSAFGGMTGLTGPLVIPQGITEITAAFGGCNFTSVSIPDGVTVIEAGAFNWTPLKGDVKLPSSLKKITGDAFAGTQISHVYMPDGLEELGRGAFSSCIYLQDTLKIPPQITTIEENLCAGCNQLEAVIIPASVERIKGGAFNNCYSMNYIQCLATEPPTIDNEGVFAGVAKDNFTIEVPEGSVDAYRNAPYWSEFKRITTYRGFVCRPAKANVLNAGGTREIVLNADAEWTMTQCPSWCHITPTSGNKKTVLTLTIDEMPHNQGNRSDSIIFKLNDSEEHITYMNINQYDYEYEEDEDITIQTASKGAGINLYFVGEGYDAKDISEGLYLSDMKQFTEYFFGVEPFTTYRDYFNVYTSVAMSNESGIGTLNTLRDTKFSTSYGDFSSNESRISGDGGAIVQYAITTVPNITEQNVDKLTCIVVANAEMYDGQTQMWDNGTSVAFCPKSTQYYPNDARGLVQHEACGHGFGKLADEYIYHMAFIQTCKCVCCQHVAGLQDMQAKGWGRNISLNGKYKNVEWSHLIFDDRYGDIVDLYEGGYFHSRGVYRSELNSCMNNNVPYFSTWSRQLIVERILDYAGEKFDFETFVSKDSREKGRDFTLTNGAKNTRSSQTSSSVHRHHSGPILMKGSPLK